MSNIKHAFQNGKAFIAFITCGDPDLETTAAAVLAAQENGADLIELGIPFSDPTAEGPVIQSANLRALQGGITTDKIFAFVKRLRRKVHIPLVFMTYANVVFSYGTQRFLQNCAAVGIDGLILPDLPFEEKEEFLPACLEYGIDLIDCSHFQRAYRHDCQRSPGISLHCFQSWRYRNQRRNQNRFNPHSERGAEKYKGSLRSRIWNLHSQAGQTDVRHLRRCHCRLCHRQTPCPIWKRSPFLYRSLCKIHEGCNKL